MDIVLGLHSLVRWVVVIVAAVAVIRFALVWRTMVTTNAKMDRGLMAGFTGLLDTQALLGIIYLVWSGLAGQGFPSYRIEHGVTMILAVAVGHISMQWRDADTKIRARNNLLVIAGVLVLVAIGVSRLPQGWRLG
jgi:hypothetical protein